MKSNRIYAVIVGAAVLLPACSYTEEVLWPSLAGEDAGSEAGAAAPDTGTTDGQVETTVATQAPRADDLTRAAPPEPEITTPGTEMVAAGPSTGTYVGRKITELRSELIKLRKTLSDHNAQFQAIRTSTIENAQRFQSNLAAIRARLQVGTTPGNPVLVKQYNTALLDLDRMGNNIARLGELSQSAAADSTMSGYIADSVRAAFTLSGAVDEDHRQLAILADESSKTAVLVERLLTELSDDLRRETAFVRTARLDLSTLSSAIKIGEILGDSLAINRQGASLKLNKGQQQGNKRLSATGQNPLVVIRFDRTNVAYQQALYNAVSSVLKQRPQTAFDLVAVAPTTGGAAQISLNSEKSRRNADSVLRTLVEMGLPSSKVNLSARTSVAARSNEVHLYTR